MQDQSSTKRASKAGKVRRGATILDVAREAHVSDATVSRVINNKGNVTPETQQRVTQAMMRLGYVANQQARSLVGGRSQVIGLLVSDVGNPYIGEVMYGIEEELARYHYDLLLYTTHRQKTKESTYVTTLCRGLADGLLLILPRNAEAYLKTLQELHFPHVLVAEQMDSFTSTSVSCQHWQGGYEAAHYLIELGHRRIAYITGRADLQSSHERLGAYKKALTDAGIPLDPDLIQEGDHTQSMGYACTQTLLALPDPPTAIVASNDPAAFGVMEAARERGVAIPDDLSVIGFDDIPAASQSHPPLTTIRQPVRKMGSLATRFLLELIEDPEKATEHVALPTELVLRQSCRALKLGEKR